MQMNICYDLKSLLAEIENACDKLFICGLGLGQESTVQSLKNLQAECGRFGLEYAGERLNKLALQLEHSRHSVRFDTSDLVKEYCLINSYLAVVKSKLQSESIKDAWRKIPGPC